MAHNRGFVLPTTLLVMTLLTVMLTAAFTMVSAEYRTTDNALARARAHSLAQAGLQTYYSLNRTLSTTYDSVRIALTSGYADVVARRLRDSTVNDDAVWLVRSTATATDPTQSGQVTARRTVVQLARFNGAGLFGRAALFAPNGVHLVGAPLSPEPTLNGTDLGCGSVNPRSALVTRTGGYTFSPSSPVPVNTGASPVIQYYGTAAAVLSATQVDWPALIAGDFTPDYVVPGTTPSWNSNEIIHVNGNFSLTLAATGGIKGEGILVVTGNLTLDGNAHWDGVIMVGGYIVAPTTGTYQVHGVTMSGLNIALGQSVPPDTLTRGNVDRHLQWRSCEYVPAIASMAALTPIGNAWADTWSTY